MNEELKYLQQRAEMLDYFNNIVQLLPIPICLLGPNQEYLSINSHCFDISEAGLHEKDFVGCKNPYDLYSKEIAENMIKHHKKVMQTGETICTEESIKDAITGKVKYFNGLISPLRDNNNKIIGTVGASIDITAEKGIRCSEIETEAAQQLSKTIREWASCLINQILIISSITAARPVNTEQISSSVDKIKDRVSKVRSIIAISIFNLNKILKAHGISYQEIYNVAISSCIDAILKQYVFQDNESEIVKWNGSENDDFICNVDELFIKIMLLGLIGDALAVARKANYGTIFINSLAGKDHNSLIFKISGSGISTKGINVFVQQYDVNTAAEVDLSLMLYKMVVRSYGGELTYSAIEDAEIVITIKFPVPIVE